MRRRPSVPHNRRPRTTALVAALVVTGALGIAPAARAAGGPSPANGPNGPAAAPVQPDPERASVVRLIAPDQAAFQRLLAARAPPTPHVARIPDGGAAVDAVPT